jgi:hypothetical protein
LFTGINVNRKWKMIELGLVNTLGHIYNQLWEDLLQNNHYARARATADTGDSSGTEFKNAFSQVTNEASVLTGSKLVDNSNLPF